MESSSFDREQAEQTSEVISIVFTIIHIINILIVTFTWGVRRKKRPLIARRFFLFIVFQATVLIHPLISLSQYIYRNKTVTDNVRELRVMMYPLFLLILLLRFWELFFLYNLSAAKVNSVLKEEGEVSSWFLKHRHFISTSFFVKAFTVLAIIQYAILFSLYGVQVSLPDLPNLLSYVFIGLTIFYIIAFLILIAKIRRVRDAFYIKKEYAGLGIWLIAMIVLYIALTQSGSGTARVVSGDLYGMLTYFGAEFISGTFPVVMSFKKSPDQISSSEVEHQSYQFESVFENDPLSQYFVRFLTNNFEVEDYLFIKELYKAKKRPSAMWPGAALIISKKFVQTGAFLHINLPQKVKNDILDALIDEDKLLKGELSTGLYDQAEKIVMARLSDLFSLFKRDELFKEYIEKEDLNATMMTSQSI